MRIAIALIALGLAACGQQEPSGPTVSEIERECGAGARPFVDTWACVKVGMASFVGYPDIKAVFIATGDYVAEQITDGKMTDAEGKVAMAQAKVRAYDASVARDQQMDAADANRRAAVAGAMLSRRPIGQPAPTYQPTIIGTPTGSILCQRTGPNSVYCG